MKSKRSFVPVLLVPALVAVALLVATCAGQQSTTTSASVTLTTQAVTTTTTASEPPAIEVSVSVDPQNTGAASGAVTLTCRIQNTGQQDVTATSIEDDTLGNLLYRAEAVWVAAGNTVPIVIPATGPDSYFEFTKYTSVSSDEGLVHIYQVTVIAADGHGTEATDTDSARVTLQPTTTTLSGTELALLGSSWLVEEEEEDQVSSSTLRSNHPRRLEFHPGGRLVVEYPGVIVSGLEHTWQASDGKVVLRIEHFTSMGSPNSVLVNGHVTYTGELSEDGRHMAGTASFGPNATWKWTTAEWDGQVD